jgi:hypothetical protein
LCRERITSLATCIACNTSEIGEEDCIAELAVKILSEHFVQQQKWRALHDWKPTGIVYVFGTRRDTVPTAQVIRAQFRAAVAEAGIAGSWTPRDLHQTRPNPVCYRPPSTRPLPDDEDGRPTGCLPQQGGQVGVGRSA